MYLTGLVETTGLAESLKEVGEEELRPAFFVAGDVLVAPGGESGEFGGIWHGLFVAESGRLVSKDCEPARRQNRVFSGWRKCGGKKKRRRKPPVWFPGSFSPVAASFVILRV